MRVSCARICERQSLFLGGLAVAAPAAHAADPASMTAFLDSTLGPGFVQAFSLIFVSELGDKVCVCVYPCGAEVLLSSLQLFTSSV